MSQRNYTLIILAVFILVFGGLIVWYFSSSSPKTTTATSTTGLISPFGTTPGNRFVSTNANNQQTGGSFGSSTGTVSKNIAKLFQVYKNPTSGDVFFIDTNGADILRFIDRAVGNAYEYVPASGTPATRLTNTTIPKIEEALWSGNGINVFLRYLENDTDTITTFTGKVTLPTATTSGNFGELTGGYLSSDVREIAVDPLGKNIFQIFEKDNNAGSYGMTSLLDGSKKSQIFSSIISYWNISWPKESTITLTTKGSFANNGLLYFLNTSSGKLTQILSGMPGLSTVTNGDASFVAYSQSQGQGFALDVYDVKKGTTESFSMPTLADKCAWGKNDTAILYCAVPTSVNPDSYPDAWYQGQESFSDDIWKIDASKQTMGLLYQIGSNSTANIDAYNLEVSPDDNYLSFMDKNDSSLWILNISSASSTASLQ
jgi:hypothetical protein